MAFNFRFKSTQLITFLVIFSLMSSQMIVNSTETWFDKFFGFDKKSPRTVPLNKIFIALVLLAFFLLLLCMMCDLLVSSRVRARRARANRADMMQQMQHFNLPNGNAVIIRDDGEPEHNVAQLD